MYIMCSGSDGIFICLSPNTDFCYGTGMDQRPLLCSHFSLWRKAKVFTGNIIQGIKIYYNPQAGFCIAQTVRVFDIRTAVIVWVFNNTACVTLLIWCFQERSNIFWLHYFQRQLTKCYSEHTPCLPPVTLSRLFVLLFRYFSYLLYSFVLPTAHLRTVTL
jgi:hypothetical protein